MAGLLLGAGVTAWAAVAPAGGMLAGLVDDRGSIVTPATLTKPYRLVVFGYTSCPDVCPLTLMAVHLALNKLAGSAARIDPVFVTVDADRDSEEKLHQYVTSFDDRIRGYRGSDEVLDRLTNQLHVRYWRESLSAESKDYSMSHTSTLFLLSRDDRVLARIDHQADPQALSKAIVKAVRAAAGP